MISVGVCRVNGACHEQMWSFLMVVVAVMSSEQRVMESKRDGKVVDVVYNLPRFSISHAFCQQDHVIVL